MKRYFTHYWRNETVDAYRESGDTSLLESIAGEQFFERGVEVGDVVYPVTAYEGVLYLICKLEAALVCDHEEATRRLGYEPNYEASQYVIAAQPTIQHFYLRVPIDVTKGLRFVSGGRVKPPVFETQDHLDKQTMRGVRELDPDSAAKLDRVLSLVAAQTPTQEEVVASDLDSLRVEEEYFEGSKKKRFTNYYERDQKLRAAAVEHHGVVCKVCGFDFEETYGECGKGYIEVHHLRPISTLGKQTKVNFKSDMTVLCSNCHRMVHRRKDHVLALEELKDLLGK